MLVESPPLSGADIVDEGNAAVEEPSDPAGAEAPGDVLSSECWCLLLAVPPIAPPRTAPRMKMPTATEIVMIPLRVRQNDFFRALFGEAKA